MASWYDSCMPKIKDIKPHLNKIAEELSEIDGINGVYIWGSYVDNITNPSHRIKDLDIIVATNFDSGDLLSVNNEILESSKTKDILIEEGFNPVVVKFSKDLLLFNKYSIDKWAISSDKAFLHWGAMPTNKEEADELKKEAESHAFFVTGINKNKLNRISNNDRQNWYNNYYDYMSKYFSDMPTGWYQSEDNLSEILKKSIKLI